MADEPTSMSDWLSRDANVWTRTYQPIVKLGQASANGDVSKLTPPNQRTSAKQRPGSAP